MRSRTRLVVTCGAALLAGVVALGAPVTTAWAQQPDAKTQEEAVAAYNAGNEKFKANKFDEALPLLQKADQLVPGSMPKYKIAVSLDKLGRKGEAVKAYQAFLDSKPPAKMADKVKESEERIQALNKEIAAAPSGVTLQVTPPDAPGLKVMVDGAPAAGMDLQLPAGMHTVSVTADGYQPFEQTVTVKAGEKMPLAVTLQPAVGAMPVPEPVSPVPVEPEPEPESEGNSDIPAYVTLGIAGAGAILGTVFGVKALQSKGDFNDMPTVDAADDAERSALIADMSFGVTLTFGITGIVLLFSGGDDEPEAETASAKPVVVPYAGTTGGGMSATWSF